MNLLLGLLAISNPLKPLENVLRHVLDWIHGTIGLPWAWSIVALTVLVRMILVPLTVKQIHSMQSLQRHAPEMKEIQRKYKGDKQKMNEELMRFYKENQINPAASCLPMLAQLPVFFALYYVLQNFSKHPPEGSLSWLGIVPSISAHANAHWSGYLLLGVYAASQVSSTLLMSTTMDKTQRTLLLVLPLVFIVFLVRFPTGLVVYWVTTNLWTVGQGLITRRLVPRTPAPSFKRSSRTPARGEDEGDAGDGAKPKPPAPKPAPAAKGKGKGKAKAQAKPKPAAAQPTRPVKRRKKGSRR